MTPEISVIVPIYNVEPYLRRCVDSILGQDFEDFELILVDDGSPDGCPAICDEYAQKDGRVRVIHQPNAGVSVARNNGVAASRAAYICFVDADDSISDRCLSTLYSAAREFDVPMVILFQCSAFTRRNGRTGPSAPPPLPRGVMDRDAALVEVCVEQYFGCFLWGRLVRRDIVAAAPCPPGRLYEDSFSVWRQIMACEKIAYIPEPLYFYRTREGSLQRRRFEPRHMDLIDAVEEMVAVFRQRGMSPAVMNAGSYKVCLACYVTAYHAAELPYRQYLSVCRRVLPLLREHLPHARATGRLDERDRRLYRFLLASPPLFYVAARLRG